MVSVASRIPRYVEPQIRYTEAKASRTRNSGGLAAISAGEVDAGSVVVVVDAVPADEDEGATVPLHTNAGADCLPELSLLVEEEESGTLFRPRLCTDQ